MEKRPTPILQLRSVKKSFKDKHILTNVSLDIYEGERFALVGRSGAGKSTLMKILIGFYTQDSGKIFYGGKDISNDLNELRKVIGFTTQENSFYENLTVEENLRYYARLYSVKEEFIQKRIDEILEAVELKHARSLLGGNISGGMKRRLDFAVSLIHNPDILILDEPTTGLDPLLVRSFWKLVNSIRDSGKTIIVVSHIFDELEENCDRIGILDRGHFAVIDDISHLKSHLHLHKLKEAFEHVVAVHSKEKNDPDAN